MLPRTSKMNAIIVISEAKIQPKMMDDQLGKLNNAQESHHII
jgi:hypothetical protein